MLRRQLVTFQVRGGRRVDWSAEWDRALRLSGSSDARFDPPAPSRLDRLAKLAFYLSAEGRRPFPLGPDKIGRLFGWDALDAAIARHQLVSLGVIKPANNATATRPTDFLFVARVVCPQPTRAFRRPEPAGRQG